jgi:uncharacterized protein involved in outer membrane biogenesis
MSARAKIAVIALILVALVVTALLLMLPRLANIDQFRPRVVAKLEQQTGRSVEIGRLTLAILPHMSIRADDVAIGNPPGFPQGHFLEIHRVYAALSLASLLQRRLAVKSLELDEPALSLLTNGSGHWNTESPRPARVQPAAWLESPPSQAVIATVQLNHGRVTYAKVSSSGQAASISFEAENVSAELHDVNPQAVGINLNPASPRQLSRSPGGSTQPGTWAPASPGILQVSWAQPQTSVSAQGPLAARGTVSAQSARFGNIEATGFKSGLELYAGGVRLDGLKLELCGGQVTGDFIWDSGSQPSQYGTHLALSGVDAARLLMAFPNAGGKLTGTLEGHLDMKGWTPPATTPASPGNPLADKEGAGELTVRNGTLPELRVNADLRQLLKNIIRTGSASADPSSFRSISADLEIGGGEMRSRQITILGDGIEMDVSGSLALDGAGRLNYQGVGKIDTRRNGYSSVLAGLLGSKITGGKITFPFTLTGTLASPRFGIKNSPWFR